MKGAVANAKTTYLIAKWTKTSVLYWFIGIWAIIQLTMCIMEFAQIDAFQVPGGMPFSYFLLLFIYVLKKEVDRWLKKVWKKRKGEYFLIGWWGVALIMYVIQFSTNGRYHVPKIMVDTCVLISIPFVIAAVSKILHAHTSRMPGKLRVSH